MRSCMPFSLSHAISFGLSTPSAGPHFLLDFEEVEQLLAIRGGGRGGVAPRAVPSILGRPQCRPPLVHR